jgi:hypothetical protein
VSAQPPPGARRRRLRLVWVGLAGLGLLGGLAGWLWPRGARPEAPDPLAVALATPEGPHDLDATIQALLELDALIEASEGLDDFLARARREAEPEVSPRLRAVRRLVLERLVELRRLAAEAEGQARLWDWTRSLLAFGQAARVKLVVSGAPRLELDNDPARAERAQADYARFLEGVQASEREREALRAELGRLGLAVAELAQAQLSRWDQACGARDRAALALRAGRPEAALVHAREAVARDPHGLASRVLLTHALVESARARPARTERPALEAPDPAADPGPALREAQALLTGRQSPPELLLQGALAELDGREEDALLHYESALLQYPRQAARLEARLHPLRWRARLLARSSAGLGALALQRNALLGAGEFSPELGLAGLHFARGQAAQGRAELLGHFARRRAQGQWDDLLADLAACYARFGEDFRRIFPEESFLALEVERAFIGQKLKVAVRHHGDRDLPNASLVLLLRFTDMLPEDYATFALPTRPVLRAGERADFGPLELPADFQVAGRPKRLHDLILEQTRAVLVSDLAVVWVDSLGFREAEIERARARRAAGEPGPEPPPAWLREAPETRLASARARLKEGLLEDALVVELPREAAGLRAVYRLRAEGPGEGEPPLEARLQGGRVVLTFPAPKPLPDSFELLLASPFADLTLAFARQADGSFRPRP